MRSADFKKRLPAGLSKTMLVFYNPFSSGSKQKKERRNLKRANEVYAAAISFVAVLMLVIVVAVFLRKEKSAYQPTSEERVEAAPQIFNLVGQISKIDGRVLTIKNPQPVSEGSKKITVTPATNITRLDFAPVITDGQRRFAPQETPVNFGALKVGWTVEALASADIAASDEFSAVQIRVLP